MEIPIFARYFKMKNRILSIFFLSFSFMSFSQLYEIGLTAGASNYVGDIGRTNYIYPGEFGAGVTFKYNLNPAIALRSSYLVLPIEGDDANASTDFQISRGRTFTNTIHEFAIGIDYNFYDYNIADYDKTWTPYLFLEVAAFNYSYVVSENAPQDYNFDRKTSFSVPVGFGIKSKLISNLAISLETKFALTFEDDIDYSTARIPSLDFGTSGNDWYMFTGVSFIYTFGRPPCYTNGF